MLVLQLDMYKTLFFAVLLLLLGDVIRKRVRFLTKYCIPGPVVGGLLFAFIALLLKQTQIVSFQFDKTLESFFMYLFFTACGFSASAGLLKKSGMKTLIFLLLASVLAFLQNVLAVALAYPLNIEPLLGLMTGSIPMTGGHGNAAAFAPLAVGMGVSSAMEVAIAAATFGLVAGSMLGGPIGNLLVSRQRSLGKDEAQVNEEAIEHNTSAMTSNSFTQAAILIFVALGFGAYIADFFKWLMPSVNLPVHVMGMLAAAIIRNIYDVVNKEVAIREVDTIGNISLGIFVSMAIMSMKLWELVDLAGPMLILLFAQVILMFLFAVFITYPVMGRDYDAAVMASGHVGFGLGAAPVAMTNMQAMCSKYRPSHIAFFIVPIVGGLFSNFTNAAIITTFLNWFGQ